MAANDPENASNRGSSPFESFGRKVDEQFSNVAPRVEEEVRKVIAYLNDEVVPAVRQHSTKALRVAAEKMSKLADYLDEVKSGG